MTDCDRLLQVLSDGQPHSHRELYRLGMIVHSRISDLRRKGHNISQWRDGDLYWYELGAVPEADSSLAAAGGPPGSDHADVSHPSAPTQPTLFTEPRKPVWA